MLATMYQHTTWKPFPRQLPDLSALVEAVLENYVRLQFDGQRLVHSPPEQLVTLFSRGKPGL
jgi:hypothetical protein